MAYDLPCMHNMTSVVCATDRTAGLILVSLWTFTARSLILFKNDNITATVAST